MEKGFQAAPMRSVEVVRLQPGDTVLVTVPDGMAQEQVAAVAEQAKVTWPDYPVVVMTASTAVRVVREVRD